MLDEDEFLSPHGLRALSASHRERPFERSTRRRASCSVDYEPGESTTGLFGGNSNWRGPVWFPVNYLVIEALRRFARFFGDDLTVEHPTGSGQQLTLAEVADELAGRLVVDLPRRRRTAAGPSSATREASRPTRRWHDMIPFHEYFHGDTGAGPRRLPPDRLDRPRRRPDRQETHMTDPSPNW